MKYKASILTFCLLVYILELAALPVYCNPAPTKESSCSSKMTNGSCKKTSSPCKKAPKDNKSNTADCCLNCPLCYVVTLTNVANPGRSTGIVKKEYPLYQSNYLFTYCSTAWKPPNGC